MPEELENYILIDSNQLKKLGCFKLSEILEKEIYIDFRDVYEFLYKGEIKNVIEIHIDDNLKFIVQQSKGIYIRNGRLLFLNEHDYDDPYVITKECSVKGFGEISKIRTKEDILYTTCLVERLAILENEVKYIEMSIEQFKTNLEAIIGTNIEIDRSYRSKEFLNNLKNIEEAIYIPAFIHISKNYCREIIYVIRPKNSEKYGIYIGNANCEII